MIENQHKLSTIASYKGGYLLGNLMKLFLC